MAGLFTTAGQQQLVALEAEVFEVGVERGDDVFERVQAPSDLGVLSGLLQHRGTELLELSPAGVQFPAQSTVLRIGRENRSHEYRR